MILRYTIFDQILWVVYVNLYMIFYISVEFPNLQALKSLKCMHLFILHSPNVSLAEIQNANTQKILINCFLYKSSSKRCFYDGIRIMKWAISLTFISLLCIFSLFPSENFKILKMLYYMQMEDE